ncbi:hypothetical protein H4R18_005948 [Coemansia javaensis]|uniref:F-box domain-containing protein n=1 Tax=Coemansia javaensis TaxID=2761396 RepID=A0A9W8LE54_9FUNG|nr:hypothetical protein H4R18_005948 [Coemansia javaensis]
MGLCDLPDDVLILIVRQTCADLDRKSGLQLRKKLLLLAVCRRLRSLALPVVYDEVYYLLLIKYDSGYINDTPLHTNLDLVSSVECLHLVQSVSIMLRTGTKPLWDLNSAVQQMRAAGERWDSVRTLRVAMDESFDNPVKLDTAFRSARKIAAALAAMPGVVFRGLRDASIGYRNLRGTKHLRIGPAELKSLELPDWPGDHSWAAFSADGDESQDIWFPSLQCESGVPHVLERGVFPARMDQYVNTDTMVAFIRCLPRLSDLDIRGLIPYHTHPDISVPEPGSDRLVEPISSTLKSMRISFYHDDQKPEPAVLVLKYLLLAVPSLSSISAHRIPSDLMAGFVDVYANQYPHLARLKINIRESRF